MREYLDKQKLLMALNEKYHDLSAMPASYYAGFQYAVKFIERLHISEDVAPVIHGKWEHDENVFDDEWSCSSCHEAWTFVDGTTPEENNVKYCPNCGAKMDLEEDE